MIERNKMNFQDNLLRPTWIEIDLDALTHNVREIKKFIGKNVNLIPVLKGDAYGCGLIETVQTLSREDIYGFGVGNIYEAIEVRKNSNLPILLFGNTLSNAIPEIQRLNIIPSVSDLDWVYMFSNHANNQLPIFIKIDIGMNRLGVPSIEAIDFIKKVSKLKNIKIEGIQTHIVGEIKFINYALEKFIQIICDLDQIGFNIPIKLAANSQLVSQLPNSLFNAVDPGKIIYGIIPFKISSNLNLMPVFTKLASKIIHIKKSIDYSPENFDRIGIIPIGMADGLPSTYYREGEAIINGKRVPIIKIHAEHTRIDLSDIPESKIRDEVILIGKQGSEYISFYEIAQKCSITESELLRGLSRCIPKIYLEKGIPSRISKVY